MALHILRGMWWYFGRQDGVSENGTGHGIVTMHCDRSWDAHAFIREFIQCSLSLFTRCNFEINSING